MKKLLIFSCVALVCVAQAVTLTATIRAEIKKRAIEKWPDDYSMQAYEIEKQSEAFTNFYAVIKPAKMTTTEFDGIKKRAIEKWTGDYSMQVYELEKQIEGWKKVNQD